MKQHNLQRIIVLLLATAIGLMMATHCKAQHLPPVLPNCCAQSLALSRHTGNACPH